MPTFPKLSHSPARAIPTSCRGDVPLAKVADRFTAKQNELEEGGGAAPILQDGSLSYLYVQYSNLYILAVTKGNVNAAATLVFLHKLIEIFKHYFHEVSLRAEAWWRPGVHAPRVHAPQSVPCLPSHPVREPVGRGVTARQLCHCL